MTPYIKQELRSILEPSLEALIAVLGQLSPRFLDGAVCYIFTKILRYLYVPPGYSEYARAIGVLETCKLELYRAVIAPYEDKKKWEHGDVEG